MPPSTPVQFPFDLGPRLGSLGVRSFGRHLMFLGQVAYDRSSQSTSQPNSPLHRLRPGHESGSRRPVGTWHEGTRRRWQWCKKWFIDLGKGAGLASACFKRPRPPAIRSLAVSPRHLGGVVSSPSWAGRLRPASSSRPTLLIAISLFVTNDFLENQSETDLMGTTAWCGISSSSLRAAISQYFAVQFDADGSPPER